MSEQFNHEWQKDWAVIKLAHTATPVLWLSSEARIIRTNPAMTATFGFDEDRLSSMTLFDLEENLTKKNWKAHWAKLIDQNTILLEAQFNHQDGQVIPVELCITLIETESTHLCGVLIREITKREDTAIKEKIQKLEQRNQLILDAAGEGIYGLDKQGHTTFVNVAAAKMVGWELEELIGKPQHDIIHHTKPNGTHYKAKDCPIYAAIHDGKVHRVNNEVFWRKDGSSFPVEYISTPIKGKDGELLGAVVIFQDITQRKAAENELKETNLNLQQALEEVEQLKSKLEEENKYLQEEINLNHNFEKIISKSKIFKKVLSKVVQVAPTDATVMIMGESGTGKELIARAVHNLSERESRALVKVNCAALPANLIESELFGHERGAFTGALNKRIGRFELADGGSIFLDEIGELPIELQSKLLRVLQEGEFERLGSARTISVNVRVIAATNRNLQEEIEKGTFREDLFYRLNVFPIKIPPLRERREDIPLLVQHFLSKHGKRFGKKPPLVTKKVMEQLTNYPWEGNVRELENVIERAMIISQGNKLELGDSLYHPNRSAKKQKITTLEENERQHILKILEMTNWRVSGENGTAKILNIKRTTLEARMKKLNIYRP